MPYIIATERALFWAVRDKVQVIETGMTLLGQTTVAGLELVSHADENEFLRVVAGSASQYKPLPAVGGWVEAGDIYGYGGGLIIVRQSHSRTIYAPEDTPALFSVYREGATGVLEWVPNERVEVGTRRAYDGVTYQCIQAHATQVDWTPTVTLSVLWIELVTTAPGSAWAVGATYALNDQVTYDGQTYRCLQAHTAIPSWTPVATLGVLWAVVIITPAWAVGVAYRGDNTQGAGNGDVVTYNGRRYRCWQTHTSQAGWTPTAVPALWIDLGPI